MSGLKHLRTAISQRPFITRSLFKMNCLSFVVFFLRPSDKLDKLPGRPPIDGALSTRYLAKSS